MNKWCYAVTEVHYVLFIPMTRNFLFILIFFFLFLSFFFFLPEFKIFLNLCCLKFHKIKQNIKKQRKSNVKLIAETMNGTDLFLFWWIEVENNIFIFILECYASRVQNTALIVSLNGLLFRQLSLNISSYVAWSIFL